MNIYNKYGIIFIVLSVGSYFLSLFLENLSVLFPKVFGSFVNAWGQAIVWISLITICIQVSATEIFWNIWINLDYLFNNKLEKEYKYEKSIYDETTK